MPARSVTRVSGASVCLSGGPWAHALHLHFDSSNQVLQHEARVPRRKLAMRAGRLFFFHAIL
jgi:hypothetical protein